LRLIINTNDNGFYYVTVFMGCDCLGKISLHSDIRDRMVESLSKFCLLITLNY